MTSLNLTRVEAAERARILSVQRYDIALDLTHGDKEFGSITTVKFTVKEPGDTFIDLRAARVREVILDGNDITEGAITLDEKGYDPTHGVALRDLTAGEHTLRITADCEYSRTGQGLHRFVDPADGETYLYTQFETADAKRVFACFDQPDLKARYKLTVRTLDNWKVISNAAQDVQKTADGEVHISRIDYPLSTYLVALCAGPYHEVRSSWTGTLTRHPETPEDQPDTITVPFGLYCRASLAPHLDAERIFEQTKQGFDWYHRNFGMAYPFGKYDQVFCPEYNMGAMENAGCVTFRDEYIFTSKVTRYLYERRCDTILHELAHMWFGDLVTMEWWGDLWLNESFATWAAAISQSEETEFDTAWVTFANIEKSWAYRQDQLPSTHPVFTDASDVETVEQNFDGITYAKGASILKQLQAYVGRDAFLAGVRRHFANHAFGNATFDDLLAALAEASGRDLLGWADQWLKTTGINTIRPRFTVQNGSYLTFEVEQLGAAPGAGELRDHRIAVGLYSVMPDTGKVVRTHRVELDLSGASTPVPELVEVPVADLVLVNDDDLTYCLMGLDQDSLHFITHHIADIEDPMARSLCWSAAWQMTRNGEMKARDFLTLVAQGAATETEIGVLELILAQAREALASYADPDWAEATGRKLLVDALLHGARSSAPGSDYQLAFVKALARTRQTEDSIAFFTSILADEPPAEGLVMDTELRWAALSILVGANAVTEVEAAIQEELGRDSSATSHNYAQRTRAAVNTPEAKQAVFAELTDVSGTLSNLDRRHKLDGFTYPGSAPSLADLGPRYFEIAADLWRGFSSEVALQVLTGLYPTWDISEDAIAAADALLAQDDLPAGLARVVAENQDRVKRALRNQRFDAA